MDCEEVIARFYERDSELWNILLTHSQCVASLAERICIAHPELNADVSFVHEAAMFHDIGIIKTSAPDIKCFGSDPYICHGIDGSQMLRSIGLDRHALVCERHTGAGISLAHIIENNLPLPHRDMCPVSTEEKIVCYADKFFSKSKNITTQKSFERAMKSVSKFGEDSKQRFLEMDALFHIPDIV